MNSIIQKSIDKVMYFCKEEGTLEQFEFGKQLLEHGNADVTNNMFVEVVHYLNEVVFKKTDFSVMILADENGENRVAWLLERLH